MFIKPVKEQNAKLEPYMPVVIEENEKDDKSNRLTIWQGK